MHNYKFDDETTQKVVEAYQSNKKAMDMEKLVKDISKAKNTFVTADIPEFNAPKFERMAEVNKTTDEIKAEAENSLKDYKNSSINKIEDDFNSGVAEINFKKEGLKNNSIQDKASVFKYYKEAKQDVSDNAINRGISRSSIVINQLNAFDKQELDDYNSIDKELSENINALDFELNSLNLQKEQAMKNFDIAYAVKLSDKINSIQEDLLDEQNKVLKYNNEIAEKELKYQVQYDELVSDIKNENIDKDAKMVDLIAKYGQKAVDTYKQNKLFDVIDNYFAGMQANEIVTIINTSKELRDALGDDLQIVLDRYK